MQLTPPSTLAPRPPPRPAPRARSLLTYLDHMRHLRRRSSRRTGVRKVDDAKAEEATAAKGSRFGAVEGPDADQDENPHFVRRSGREKKLRYDNFGETALAKEAAKPVTDSSETGSDDDSDSDGDSDASGEGKERHLAKRGRSKGSRRERRPTDRYSPPQENTRRRRPDYYFDDFDRSPRKRRRQYSPERRSRGSRGSRRRPGRRLAGNGSSTTENEFSDDDGRNFEERRDKSMRNARAKIQPMNAPSANSQEAGIYADRMKSSNKGDIEPMAIDKWVPASCSCGKPCVLPARVQRTGLLINPIPSPCRPFPFALYPVFAAFRKINFGHVGGLAHHVRALTEMIVFPLVYPEFFSNFKMDAPRGVLFYGPPGTGKTLVARALANECSKAGKHVSFFMRKGADCVSKWIGESERMLRLLFDQAYKMRPSIIFFDEIDGLAPVRSSRTDSNYSSIVSTLLAMMDGLDSRGEVIVIGATVRRPCPERYRQLVAALCVHGTHRQTRCHRPRCSSA